jgi:O-glycosyl hydrolase
MSASIQRAWDARPFQIGSVLIMTVAAGLAAPAARAESVQIRALANGRLVQALPGGPATASGGRGSALAEYRRLYLGNGWFVLQSRFDGLCLSVNQRSGLVSEAALRDGGPNEQFQAVAQPDGSVALRARANGRYLEVGARQDAALTASAASPTPQGAFVLAATRPGEAVAGQADLLHPRQRIVGFGGALVFNEARLAANPYRGEIYHALYDPKDGLGITMLRIGNNYRISEADAGGYADFNPDLVGGASRALGRPVTVVMSGWGPPADLKSNGSTTGGTLARVNGQYDYAGYARWWADSVNYWRAQGIDPSYVSIQNEPEVIVDYISNHFNPQEDVPYGDGSYGADRAASYGKALDAVHQAFQGLPSPPRLLGPEVDGTAHAKVEDFLAHARLDQLYAIAHHLYDTADPGDPDSFEPTLEGVADAFPDKLKFQTEWFSNDAPMVEAKAIHDVLVSEGANAYIKWSLANSATVASAIYDDDATQPASTWLYPHGWHVNDNYYVMKHYSYFIRPGFRRVDAYVDDPDLRLSAYVDPAPRNPLRPRATVVVLNTSATATIPLTLAAPVPRVGSSRVLRTSFGGNERWRELGAWHAGAPIVLPPNSMATVAFNPD